MIVLWMMVCLSVSGGVSSRVGDTWTPPDPTLQIRALEEKADRASRRVEPRIQEPVRPVPREPVGREGGPIWPR